MSLTGAFYVPNTPTLIGDLGVKHDDTERALKLIGEDMIGKPEAVFVVSPHFVTEGGIGIVAKPKLNQLYDFYGFPKEFYEVRYTPPGSPALAEDLLDLAEKDNLPLGIAEGWGLDHGAWSPLIHIFPMADVPIIPVSISNSTGTKDHERVGTLIRRLSMDHEVAIISTGSIIHRLDLWQKGVLSVPENALKYLDTCLDAFRSGNWEEIWKAPRELLDSASPEGGELPLRVLSGAVGNRFKGEILANETEFGSASLTTASFTPVP